MGKKKYRIVKTDGPRDEYEALYIPHEFCVQVKGMFMWHDVKYFQDFKEDFAKSEAEELLENLQADSGPTFLKGEWEALEEQRAFYEQHNKIWQRKD